MTAERLSCLPDWPARMAAQTAALYLSVSLTKFNDGVRRKCYPAGVRDGGNIFWSRIQLDRYVAAQFGLGNDNC
jgi:hypothetical protein